MFNPAKAGVTAQLAILVSSRPVTGSREAGWLDFEEAVDLMMACDNAWHSWQFILR
ncbi:MAG TPA: hypothetical protein PLS39_08975 [Accumulibacter sp.]|nr:hypothetical protein [Accumulibacter sp.]HND80540.1 hypothetical protein [Accumulibacter sp.]HNI72441.1 hypothetical protein [Accumulibacter sp.]